MKNIKTKCLIIGAGVSGLSLANYVKDYLIIEKEKEIGGYCRTIKQDGFIWDYAGHFFHFNTDEFKEKFLKSVAKDDIIYKEKCTKIFYKGNLIDYPFQTNIHQLPKNEFIDCLYDLFNKTEKNTYDNFLDMLYGKFGKSIVEKFLKPYNEKLYACDLKKLDVDAMGRFFPYADIKAIINNMKKEKDNSYNNTFLYPKNGAGSFMDILYSSLDKEKVLLNEEINRIDLKNKIAYTDDLKIEYEYLVNTSPLNKFLNILNSEEFSNLEKELSYNKVLVFNLGFDKKSKYIDEHWIYVPDKEINFYRIGFYDNILSTDRLSMYIEIGYGKNDNITDDEIKEQLEKTLENLKKMRIIDDSYKLLNYVSIIMDPAYVHISKETDEEVKKVFKTLEGKNIFSIGRYGAWTYCSMEDCMVEAKKIANKINERGR